MIKPSFQKASTQKKQDLSSLTMRKWSELRNMIAEVQGDGEFRISKKITEISILVGSDMDMVRYTRTHLESFFDEYHNAFMIEQDVRDAARAVFCMREFDTPKQHVFDLSILPSFYRDQAVRAAVSAYIEEESNCSLTFPMTFVHGYGCHSLGSGFYEECFEHGYEWVEESPHLASVKGHEQEYIADPYYAHAPDSHDFDPERDFWYAQIFNVKAQALDNQKKVNTGKVHSAITVIDRGWKEEKALIPEARQVYTSIEMEHMLALKRGFDPDDGTWGALLLIV